MEYLTNHAPTSKKTASAISGRSGSSAVRGEEINLDGRQSVRRLPGLSRENRPDFRDLPNFATVIAFDPGGTTGWSLISVQPEVFSELPEHKEFSSVLKNVLEWKHGQIDCGSQKGNLGTGNHHGVSTSGEAAGINEIIGLVRAWPGAAIIVEDFILREHTRNRDLLAPVRITAGLNQDLWLCRREYFVQSAALAKTAVTDERLKNWGYYSRAGGLNHARDADRHALTFLRRAANKDSKGRALREAAWPYLYGPDGKYYPRRWI